jgi:hypothetical protein
MALARASEDPALKERYEEMALKFVQNVGTNPDDTDMFLDIIKSNPDSGTSIANGANNSSAFLSASRFASSEKSVSRSTNLSEYHSVGIPHLPLEPMSLGCRSKSYRTVSRGHPGRVNGGVGRRHDFSRQHCESLDRCGIQRNSRESWQSGQ